MFSEGKDNKTFTDHRGHSQYGMIYIKNATLCILHAGKLLMEQLNQHWVFSNQTDCDGLP